MLNRIIGGMFLISGTSIGAGMLGLPIKTLGINANLNFIMLLINWLIMLIAALATLEISFWVKNELNIISITKTLFGKKTSSIIAIFYIFFLYSLIIAYISGGTSILTDSLSYNKYIIYKIFFIIPFYIINYYGIKIIDYINKMFFFVY